MSPAITCGRIAVRLSLILAMVTMASIAIEPAVAAARPAIELGRTAGNNARANVFQTFETFVTAHSRANFECENGLTAAAAPQYFSNSNYSNTVR